MHIVNNLRNFEFGAVQRFLNLVDFEKKKERREQHAYLVVKIGVDTDENEPSKGI